jgi:hypothetical protein
MLDQGYGIMPNVVLFDNDLSPTAKLVFVYISSLCAKKGYCWSSNEHIGLKFGISKTQVSRHISSLGKYITIENPSNEKRKIRLAENVKAGGNKAQASLAEKRKHNITREYYKDNTVKSNYKTPAQLGMPDLGGYEASVR